jgi:hypothetical protein
VATPPCSEVKALATTALHDHAELVAYQRAVPVIARGDETNWPEAWYHDDSGHSLTATKAGQDVAHIAVASTQNYELWLGGSFGRGFQVSLEGRHIGTVKDELSSFNGYVYIAKVHLSAGVHTFVFTYPHSNLTPGSGDEEFTVLSAITLQPENPPSEMIEVAPAQATRLCGRPLDWIEIVKSAS